MDLVALGREHAPRVASLTPAKNDALDAALQQRDGAASLRRPRASPAAAAGATAASRPTAGARRGHRAQARYTGEQAACAPQRAREHGAAARRRAGGRGGGTSRRSRGGTGSRSPRPREARARPAAARASMSWSYFTPDGHAVTHAMQPRQLSRCADQLGRAARSRRPPTPSDISTMRPRGESISSPHSDVRRAGRQAEPAVHAVVDRAAADGGRALVGASAGDQHAAHEDARVARRRSGSKRSLSRRESASSRASAPAHGSTRRAAPRARRGPTHGARRQRRAQARDRGLRRCGRDAQPRRSRGRPADRRRTERRRAAPGPARAPTPRRRPARRRRPRRRRPLRGCAPRRAGRRASGTAPVDVPASPRRRAAQRATRPARRPPAPAVTRDARRRASPRHAKSSASVSSERVRRGAGAARAQRVRRLEAGDALALGARAPGAAGPRPRRRTPSVPNAPALSLARS